MGRCSRRVCELHTATPLEQPVLPTTQHGVLKNKAAAVREKGQRVVRFIFHPHQFRSLGVGVNAAVQGNTWLLCGCGLVAKEHGVAWNSSRGGFAVQRLGAYAGKPEADLSPVNACAAAGSLEQAWVTDGSPRWTAGLPQVDSGDGKVDGCNKESRCAGLGCQSGCVPNRRGGGDSS